MKNSKHSLTSLPDYNRIRDEIFRRGLPDKNCLPFPEWLSAVSPRFRWDWTHLRYTQERLANVTAQPSSRLMLFYPPRHGKSEMTTVRYALWRIERQPSLRVIIGAYNTGLAETFSRKALSLAREGGRLALNPNLQAAANWETIYGGGIRAAGVGSGVTGRGADLIIIDDPVKSRAEANSAAYRQRVWDWYRDDLYTRLEPGGTIVLIMTRWHTDDLAGRILDSEDGPKWQVVSLPALAEENDLLAREVGEALCRDRYDEAQLHSIRTVLGNWSFAALYQQRPAPAEGGMFKRSSFEIVDELPAGCRFVRYWDKAATPSAGDYSASELMATTGDGLYYVANVLRGQWSADERNRLMVQTAALDKTALRPGERLSIWAEQEGGSSGKESAEITVRLLAGYDVHTETSTGSKEVRAMPFAAQCEAGNVKLLRGAWNAAFLEELASFPFGTHDDQVDASSGAFNKIAAPPRGFSLAFL